MKEITDIILIFMMLSQENV